MNKGRTNWSMRQMEKAVYEIATYWLLRQIYCKVQTHQPKYVYVFINAKNKVNKHTNVTHTTYKCNVNMSLVCKGC